jgi:hypothetical protein
LKLSAFELWRSCADGTAFKFAIYSDTFGALLP